MSLQKLAVKIYRLGVGYIVSISLALTYMYIILRVQDPTLDPRRFPLLNFQLGMVVTLFYVVLLGLAIAGQKIVSEIRSMYSELLIKYTTQDFADACTEIHNLILEALSKAGYDEDLVNYALFGVEERNIVFVNPLHAPMPVTQQPEASEEVISEFTKEESEEEESVEESGKVSESRFKEAREATPEEALHSEGIPSGECGKDKQFGEDAGEEESCEGNEEKEG